MNSGKGWKLALLATIGLSASAAWADVVTFAATGPGASAWSVGPGASWSPATGPAFRSTVSPPGGDGSKYATGNASFILRPVLGVPGGRYRFQITHTARPLTGSGQVSTTILVKVTAMGCTLMDHGGNVVPYIMTTAFQRPGGNTWEGVGQIQLNPATAPMLTFTSQGTYSDTGRFYTDGFRFEYMPPCHTPAVDADDDDDVDQDDFAAFQLCFSGQSTSYLGESCHCFDRDLSGDSDDDIDSDDLDAFELCATGPAINWTPRPGCQ